MATRLEVGSALASLAGLSDLSSKAKLQCAFPSPLPEAGGQAGERPGPLSLLRLEERGPGPATLRPRLTPRPFCRERSAEAFAAVKPPVPALKPCVSARTLEDLPAARGLTGSVPPLLEHTLVEGRAGGDVGAHVPFYASPQANTVILFESGSLTPDRHLARAPGTLGTALAPEGKLPPSAAEASHRRTDDAGIQRQLSLSPESRPGPWSAGRPLERTDPLAEAPEGPRQPGVSPASGGQPRLKQRPVSALFLESAKDPKPCAPSSTDEKPWVRKPRPLSVDLTARFEPRDLSVQRKPGLSEGQERLLAAPLADGGHSRPSEMGLTAGGDWAKPGVRADARSSDPQAQKPSPGEAASSGHGTPADSGLVSAKDRKCLREPRLKAREEQAEAEASAKRREPCSSKGQAAKGRAASGQTCPAGENSARAAGAGGRSVRGAAKLLGPPDPAADGAAPAEAEWLPASPDRESRILSVQQRIRELTAESAEAKPGSLRRAFRSRPLSADLAKLFSSSAAGSDGRPERQTEQDRKPLAEETQEVPEGEARPPSGPGCREAPLLGPPWKPQPTGKTLRTDGALEKAGGFARERPGGTPLQAEGPKPPPTAAADTPRLRTVRATVFEHSVQRHHVAADRLVAEPGPAGGQSGPCREPRLEGQAAARKGPCRPAEAFPEDPASAARERLARPTQGPVEDSLQHQRIEPRYEVLQTVGERVRSEAVAAVAEDKAVTLRSRRSLRERRRTEEGVPWPCSLDLQGGGWREDGSASRAKDLGAAAVKTGSVQRRDVPPSPPWASYEQASEWQRSQAGQQQQVPVRGASAPSRRQGLGAAEAPLSSLSSERGNERREGCLAGRTEASQRPKHFPESLGAQPGCGATESGAGGQESPTRSSSPKGPPAGVDSRTCAREAPRGLGVRKTPSEEPAVPGCLQAGERSGPLGVDEGDRSSPRGAANPRAADRWRRRTLPHGAAHLEAGRALAGESAKALSRRDSLQLHSPSLSKRHRGGAEPRPSEGSASPQRPRSPSKPRAASGAGSAQGPEEDGSAVGPFQSQPVAPVAEAPLRSPGAATPRTSQRQTSVRPADPPGSLDRQRSKSWRDGATPDLPRPADTRGEPGRDGVPLQAPPQPPCSARPSPQDPPGPQNCSRGWAQGRGADGYRSRVLDIDALMAEYREVSQRGPSDSFPWEKPACRRSSADKTPGSHPLSSPHGRARAPSSSTPGLRAAADPPWPGPLRPSEPARESSPPKASDVPLSPPHWCRQAADRTRKTFILDEDHGESLLLRHQQAQRGGGDPPLASAARLEVGVGAGHAPRPSQALPEGGFPKEPGPARQAGGALLEDRRGGGADVVFSAPSEARARISSPKTGLANTPHDLRRSYSEKVRQTRARGDPPAEAREGAQQSSLPGRAAGRLGRRGTAGQEVSIRDEKRDLEGGRPEQGHGGAGLSSPPNLPARRRSRSFYKERRTDHWAADQLKECSGRPAAEAKDTDTLVQEADSQYGTWSGQRHSGDSFAPESPSSESHLASARRQPPGSRLSSFSSHTDPPSAADLQDSSREQRSSTSLDRSSTDVDSADGAEGSVPADACPDFSFLGHTPVLDSSALKTRVQLSKRRRQHRAPISHSLRRSTGGDADRQPALSEEADSAWMFQDCTEVKPAKRDDSEQGEGAAPPMERSPGSPPQRLPVFPGMDHSVLKAQLRRRQETEGAGELPRPPKSPFQARAPGPRGLPAGVEKEEERSEEPSPQWLRELKSKKRQSHHENQV